MSPNKELGIIYLNFIQYIKIALFLTVVTCPITLGQDKVSPPKASLKLNEAHYQAWVKAIKHLSPQIKNEKAERVAGLILKHSKKFKIDGKIMIAIIQVESNFKQNAISSTGDFSLAQINYKIWNKELTRLGRKPLNLNRLKNDHEYAISRMAEILHILSQRYESDPEWYAHYHSKTPKLKNAYAKKVRKHLKEISPLVAQNKFQ